LYQAALKLTLLEETRIFLLVNKDKLVHNFSYYVSFFSLYRVMSTKCRVNTIASPDSSIGLPWDGTFLNLFFSFIGVGVSVEVALHRLRPC